MTAFVLHHYSMSPFSEKIRAMLGYAGMSWCGVQVSEKPPRSLLEPLSNGYRRIPVAQVGADIYCDSQIIADEIAFRAAKPELMPIGSPLPVMELMAYADGPIFIASIMNAGGIPLLRQVIRQSGMRQLVAVLSDRARMAMTAKVEAPSPRKAKRQLNDHLDDLEQRLSERDFLFAQTPTIADFSCYHSLWFLQVIAGKSLLVSRPHVQRWFAAMQQFSANATSLVTAWQGDQALALAASFRPAALPGTLDHVALGRDVAVSPSDYGRDAVKGTLLAVTDDRYILGHHSAATGELHIHLPRRGYALQYD